MSKHYTEKLSVQDRLINKTESDLAAMLAHVSKDREKLQKLQKSMKGTYGGLIDKVDADYARVTKICFDITVELNRRIHLIWGE
jgi:hypothetical protein